METYNYHKNCEQCKYYRMIDSGYGHCLRYPPTRVMIKLLPIRYDITFPVVAWCNVRCGEFELTQEDK